MIAFVTGATGFLGSHLAERLVARGDEVRCLVRRTSERRWLAAVAGKLRFIEGDLDAGADEALAEGLRGAEVVFHLAGLTKAPSREAFFRVNEGGTAHLLDACERHADRLARFVLVSSISAVGPSPPGEAIVEGQECRPLTDYGASKLAGERLALARRDRLPVAVVRPPAVYGPRDVDALALFRSVARHVRPVGSRRVSFVHALDVVEALLLAAERDEARGEVFHASGPPQSITETGRAIARALGVGALPVFVPRPAFFALAGASELWARLAGRKTILNLQKAREFTASWEVSSAKACARLGWAARFAFEEGARETALWYRKEGWL